MKFLLLISLSLATLFANAQDSITLLQEAQKSADGMLDDCKAAILQERFPELVITQKVLIEPLASSKVEQAATSLVANQWTSVHTKPNGTQETIKVLQRYGETPYAKVKYISLGKEVEEPRELALSLVARLKDGESFDRLWERHAVNFNVNRGELDWFRPESMVAAFRDAVLSHHKGDVYAVKTEAFGWMVVVTTHEPILALSREVLHICTKGE